MKDIFITVIVGIACFAAIAGFMYLVSSGSDTRMAFLMMVWAYVGALFLIIAYEFYN